MTTAARRGYSDPIRAGIALGLVLFAVIMIAGRGLGASGGFAAAAAATVGTVAPEAARGNDYVAARLPEGSAGIFGDWLVVELLGVALGGWLSARLAGRRGGRVERVGGESSRSRLGAALAGGILMGAGARLARGCTSGLGLTGGALLATGAWVFIPFAFATAFLVAWLRRRGTAVAA